MKGPALLREMNERRVLVYLRANVTSSRQEITESLGLSKNTVSLIIDEFLKKGVIREIGLDPNGVGRPRMKIALNPDVFFSVGFHIRHHSLEVVVTNFLGKIVESQMIKVKTYDPDSFFNEIESLWPKLEKKYPSILGLGIAVPGLVDPNQGLLHFSSHLGWKNINFSERLSHLSVPIHVFNRVKAAAFSPVKVIPEEAESTFYIRIDEGVGGAFVLKHDVLDGYSYNAGEIGHLPVETDGPLCQCGQRGCLERLVALPYVVELLKKRGVILEDDEEFLIPNEGMEEFERTMSETGSHMGTAIAAIINLLNPQYVVVDSPYNKEVSFKESTLSITMEKALAYPAKHSNIVFASTSQSSAWGMAIAVIRKFETR